MAVRQEEIDFTVLTSRMYAARIRAEALKSEAQAAEANHQKLAT